MVRAVPGCRGIPRGHLSAGSAVFRAVGEGPRGQGIGGEGLPRQPREPRGTRPRPRPPGVLAEVVLSGQPVPPRQRRPARLAAGAQAAADQPVPAGQRARPRYPPWGRAGSRGARSNSPRSAPAARTGGPWASRRPARPICSAAHSRPPPRSYSPTPCPAARNPARITPRPTPSGSASGRMPGATPAPENYPSATSSRRFTDTAAGRAAVADHRRTVTSPSGASRSVRSSTAAGIGPLLAAALHGPQEYAYAGPQDGEVAEHLDHQHYPGRLGFRGDVPETHR